MTRSPIELFWTAKNVQPSLFRRSAFQNPQLTASTTAGPAISSPSSSQTSYTRPSVASYSLGQSPFLPSGASRSRCWLFRRKRNGSSGVCGRAFRTQTQCIWTPNFDQWPNEVESHDWMDTERFADVFIEGWIKPESSFCCWVQQEKWQGLFVFQMFSAISAIVPKLCCAIMQLCSAIVAVKSIYIKIGCSRF